MLKRINKQDDTFDLYDLRVEVVKGRGKFVCSHKAGGYFEVIGENIVLPKGTKFSMYALSTLLPLLPAKQRETDPNDFITTDELVACPDPNCGALFRITRIRKRTFKHSDVSVIPLKKRRKI